MSSKPPIFSQKQTEFIHNANKKYNLAHGSVRTGKTICTLYRFLQAAYECPGDQIWMVGHTLETIYDNVIQLLFNSPQLNIFAPLCTWFPGKHELRFFDKTISCLGAKDERALAPIQGKTFDLCYCDELTLYPESIIQMIITRLSMPHSKMYASMNPIQPSSIIREKLIQAAMDGDPKYYELHFQIDDNPFLTEEYKESLRQTLSGLFYRRNYLGEWCLAEGAIFDFFDRNIHVSQYPPRSAEYWIGGIDYGASNPFAAVLVGFNSGRYTQEGPHMWVEKEYYYDPKKVGRQKTNAEFARDLQIFFGDYSIRSCYIDPSAASMKTELSRLGIATVDAYNEVLDGILILTNLLKVGSLSICAGCTNLIREMEGYVWDPGASKKGLDAPLKQNDHLLDATRYACASFMKGRKTMKRPDTNNPDFGRTLGFRSHF